MASQSRKGGGTWSAYMSDPLFRHGWNSVRNGEPFDYDVWRSCGYPKEVAASAQRMYEHGRAMAIETGMPLPAHAKRTTKEMKAAVIAAPALRRQINTEIELAREEARRAASLRMKLMHHQRRAA